MLNSAIYQGVVFHQRHRHVHHAFKYPVFMMYLDLDELDEVFSKSIFWSYRKPNLVRMKAEDYFYDPEQGSIKATVMDFIKRETGNDFSGKICLLTNLRFMGFLINPISCYFCFDEYDKLVYLVAEVTNTPWKERKHYLLELDESNDIYSRLFKKQLHVSPFMENDMTYLWKSNRPEKQLNHVLNISLENFYQGNLAFKAGLRLERQEITAFNLNSVVIRFPFLCVKIVMAIYWQALRLLIKRVPVVKHVKPGELIDES